ncbi:MAG: DUF2306 domain-containing protein [Myxococcaceae bacterium]|nr:DUF2306 domain-containing protein [Myxococcaceae bacterium]
MKVSIALVVLSLIPMLGGTARLLGFTGVTAIDGQERFAADPVPAVLHIVTATSFATLGALQFAPRLRRRRWHRVAGRVLAPLGIIASLSGIYMVATWPPKLHDSAALNALRVTAASAMVVFIVVSVVAARRRDFDAHARWMTRAYALGAAAGTSALTLGPAVLLNVLQTEAGVLVLNGAGWLINVAVAEWALRRP